MAGVLPPLGDGPRGSPVWCSFLFVDWYRPPSSNKPSGSRQGVTPCTPYRALWARGRSRESKLAAKLPPLGDGPRGSRQGVTPCTPHRAHGAREYSRKSDLAAELPPLGDRPRGSRAWCVFLFVGVYRPPSGDRPSGSLQRPAECGNTIGFLPCKGGHATSNYPNPRHLAFAPTQAAAEQSGDRQRREKALPFLKEEKSEHERAR